MTRRTGKGWFNESRRHALASKGVKTGNQRIGVDKRITHRQQREVEDIVDELAKLRGELLRGEDEAFERIKRLKKHFKKQGKDTIVNQLELVRQKRLGNEVSSMLDFLNLVDKKVEEDLGLRTQEVEFSRSFAVEKAFKLINRDLPKDEVKERIKELGFGDEEAEEIMEEGQDRLDDLLQRQRSASDRASASKDVLGLGGRQSNMGLEEGKHYEVLSYTDWLDVFQPTTVKWANGEVDDFEDLQESRENAKESKRIVARDKDE